MTKETSDKPETVLVAEHLSNRGFDVVFVHDETIELFEDGSFKETELEIDEILEDGTRKREIIVIGGGPSVSRLLQPRLGLSTRVLADAIMQSALVCGPDIIAEEPTHDWMYADSSKQKVQIARKHLSAGEIKTRAKKLKAQRTSRRYNRKR